MNLIRLFILFAILAIRLEASSPLDVFPKTVEEMQEVISRAKAEALSDIETIAQMPKEARTFENTVIGFDYVAAKFYVPYAAIATLEMLHPDEAMRKEAEALILSCQEFVLDAFHTNRAIYQAFKECEHLATSQEDTYYLTSTISEFKKAGLELSEEEFLRVRELSIKLGALGVQYYANIAKDQSTLKVKYEELTGIDDAYISALERDGEHYILPVNSPTVDKILSCCDVETTRRALYELYTNRACPQNLAILQQVRELRHELALLLGYASYAELDISSQMAKTPASVQQFLAARASQSIEEATKTWALYNNGNDINRWDLPYFANQYKKNRFGLDQEQLRAYFPFKKTLDGMFKVFGKFLGMEFCIIPTEDLWHQDALLVEVRADDALVGHIVFDLFPRPNKYTHACCNGVVADNKRAPLAVVIANLTPQLSHSELKTLFHEFGHAIHALCGKCKMPTKSGYNTTCDFIETPSQLFEEWVHDSEILTLIADLSEEIIEKLIASSSINDGLRATLAAEICYSLQALEMFGLSQSKPLVMLERDIQKQIMPSIRFAPDANSLCTFEHLINYGAKYYSYLWSKEIAKSFYAYIKANGGPLDPLMGKRYLERVVGRGGSLPPEVIVDDFLHGL